MARVYLLSTIAKPIAWAWPGRPIAMGETMKIYLLTILISTIALLSHLGGRHQSPGRRAGPAST
jgi:hypothetical protein